MKRVYHKKNFIFSMFCLVMAVLDLLVLLNSWHDLDGLRLAKKCIFMLLLFGIGVNTLMRSLNARDSEEDQREDFDERNQLVTLKSQSRAFLISFNACLVFQLLIIITYAMTRIEALLYGVVSLGLFTSFMFFTVLGTGIYYEKKC